MKKISVMIILAMLISSLSVFAAAPQINYMFFHPEEKTFYAFGSYDKVGLTNGVSSVQSITGAGVYLGDDFSRKYGLHIDDDPEKNMLGQANAMENPKFGIGFHTDDYTAFDEDGGFSVTPYQVYKSSGEIRGSAKKMNVTDTTPAPSNNADLAYFNIVCGYNNKENKFVTVSPEFDPDVTEYTVTLHTNSSSYLNAGYHKIYGIPADSGATVASYANNGSKLLRLTVTAADGVTTKVYNFTLSDEVSTIDDSNVAMAAYADELEYNNSSKAYVNIQARGDNNYYFNKYTLKQAGNNSPIISFNIADKKSTITSSGHVFVSVALQKYNTNSQSNVKNPKIYAYGVTGGVNYDKDGDGGYPAGAYKNVAYPKKDDLGDLVITEQPIGDFTYIGGYNTAAAATTRAWFDVTDYVKARAAAGDDNITIILRLQDYEIINALDSTALTQLYLYGIKYSTLSGLYNANQNEAYYGPRLIFD